MRGLKRPLITIVFALVLSVSSAVGVGYGKPDSPSIRLIQIIDWPVGIRLMNSASIVESATIYYFAVFQSSGNPPTITT